jgi:hypothetical protein
MLESTPKRSSPHPGERLVTARLTAWRLKRASGDPARAACRRAWVICRLRVSGGLPSLQPSRTRLEPEHRDLDRYGERAGELSAALSSQREWSGTIDGYASAAAKTAS